MNKFIRPLYFFILVFGLSGCGIDDMIRKNDDRYATPGALDLPITGVNDVYQVKFLDHYKIKHEWPRISNCEYRKVATLGVGPVITP